MALHEKVKTALDETRTQILGAQILLGFQYQVVFQEQFERLPAYAQATDGWALGLMLLTVGLLIAPSAIHRVVERGESTGRFQTLAGRLATTALLPFAMALGLDLAIALGRGFDHVWAGRAAGLAFTLLALGGWYGMGALIQQRHGASERAKTDAQQNAHEVAPLHARIEQMLTEGRVILPGAQALLGFQLVIVLTSAFERLPAISRLVHGLALLFVSAAVILLITPAALHRIVWAGEDSETLLRAGGWVTVAALVPLALGMTGDTYVVLARIARSPLLGAMAASAVIMGLLGLWVFWPVALRWRPRARPFRDEDARRP